MRTTTKIIIFGGYHTVPDDWDLIIRCRLKHGDKILKPWGEWELIPRNIWGISTKKNSWDGTYVIRRKPQVDLKIQNLIDISVR